MSKRFSLNQRILFSAALLLVLFISITAAALNRAHFRSTQQALHDTLDTQLYALLSVAEVDVINAQTVFTMPSTSLTSLLGQPSSGLYAHVINQQQKVLWQSESSSNIRLPQTIFLAPGKQYLRTMQLGDIKILQLSYGVEWLINDKTHSFTFIITKDLKNFNTQINHFNDTLWFWLGGMTLFFIISQTLILRWGLLPIRQVVDELKNIEAGKQQKIAQPYPREIEYLSDNINHLLAKEKQQKKRYRHALGDLAHSLKTPLAVIQNNINLSTDDNSEVQHQIKQMNQIVEYQLQKASTAGKNHLSSAIDVSKLINRIEQSLQKVYVDKQVTLHLQPNNCLFKADEGDMMELFGNLLDNAFKWTKSKIKISLSLNNNTLQVRFSDDGKGFPKDLIEELKLRGKRADQQVAGHGIGLSIVSNIVESYGGQLEIENSTEQGSIISFELN